MSNVIDFNLESIKAYTIEDVRTLISNFSFYVEEKETIGILGESGSGKTISMIALLNRLPKNVKFCGTIQFMGEDIKKHLDEICYIPQSSLDSLNPSLTIEKHFKLFLNGVCKKDFINEVKKRLDKVGLDESVLKKYPFEISGGMAQKVILALLMNDKIKLVIADEITSGLDEKSKNEYLSLFFKVFKNASKIIITHEMSLIKYMNKIYILKDGKLLESLKSDDIVNALKHPYSVQLLKSGNLNDFKLKNYRSKKGYCPFYQFCEMATQECAYYAKNNGDVNHKWRCNHVRN